MTQCLSYHMREFRLTPKETAAATTTRPRFCLAAAFAGLLRNDNHGGCKVLRIARDQSLKTFREGFNQDVGNRSLRCVPGAFSSDMRRPKPVRHLRIMECPGGGPLDSDFREKLLLQRGIAVKCWGKFNVGYRAKS
ncbi:MAG: hypothetical protein JWL59_1444 [Chthoniobacteraceae bacterium]|nr:hypothetical protein [Chthoniobacteraceae bacterium]